jgi:3-oxoacyl-[acyl-carrier protein] reductase
VNLGLEGKVCVVTGATRGIGAATARMLAQEGARVLSVARHGSDLRLDVTARDAAERVLQACPSAPWALVNAAGTSRARPLDELSEGDWQQQWELHVMGPIPTPSPRQRSSRSAGCSPTPGRPAACW